MSDDIQLHLSAAYRRLLKPLVRILLRHGMSYRDFVEITKAVFVDVAGTDFTLDENGKSSDSRIAILTGLTRKEVKRQRELMLGQRQPEAAMSRAAKVLEGWHHDPEFLGPFDVPMTLVFDGPSNSFTELVRKYSGDMPARAMLEELKRVGAVTETVDGEIQALSRSYIPVQASPESLERLGEVMHDLGANFEHNVNPTRRGVGLFERRVFTREGISKDDLENFSRVLRDKGPGFLATLDDVLADAQEKSSDLPDSEKIRAGVEVFLFIDRDVDIGVESDD